MKTILKAENLIKTYQIGEVKEEALKNADFEMSGGEQQRIAR